MKTPGIKAPASPGHSPLAFTLVEVMVSMALVVLIMALLLQTVDGTQKVWSRGRSKISQFQSARNSFESMTRQLSQATLNTYYDVEYRNTGGVGLTQNDPINFFRQSELHFVSGKAAQTKLFDAAKELYPTQAVFFQTAVGYSSPFTRSATTSASANKSNSRDLSSLLTSIGYFVKWGDDEDVPNFVKDLPARKKINRFRLYQVQSPSEGLGLFTTLSQTKNPPLVLTKTTGWIKIAAGIDQTLDQRYYNVPPRMLAENIVALVLIPKLPVKERSSEDALDLAPDYEYDSRPAKPDGTPMSKTDITAAGKAIFRQQFNQLPPIIQVTMVAIDEPSAARLQEMYGDTPPPLASGLFEKIKNEKDFDSDLGMAFSSDPANADSLVRRMLDGIDGAHIAKLNYRIYTTDVVLRGSKWSADESGKF